MAQTKQYYALPFPFDKIIGGQTRLKTQNLDTSIRENIRFLILTRLGEYTYDKTLGFVMWEHDKKVFYHEKEPYYEEEVEITYKGLMEDSRASKNFKKALQTLIQKNEIRLQNIEATFKFHKFGGKEGSIYQRRIQIEIQGRIESTGTKLHPPFSMEILYAPFRDEINYNQ